MNLCEVSKHCPYHENGQGCVIKHCRQAVLACETYIGLIDVYPTLEEMSHEGSREQEQTQETKVD